MCENILVSENNQAFWQAIDTLVSSGTIVIDRPKGSAHPRYPDTRYEVDYGYIDATASMDRDGIDVFRGTRTEQTANAIICTVDLVKRDSEMKILIGCTEEEINAAYRFCNRTASMKGILIRR